ARNLDRGDPGTRSKQFLASGAPKAALAPENPRAGGQKGGIAGRATLVFVRLPHDRRINGGVLFFLLLVFFLPFLRISRWHHVANGREGAPVYPSGNLLGDMSAHVVAPRM